MSTLQGPNPLYKPYYTMMSAREVMPAQAMKSMDRMPMSKPPPIERAKRLAYKLWRAVARDRALRADRKRQGHSSKGHWDSSSAIVAEPVRVPIGLAKAINSNSSATGKSM